MSETTDKMIGMDQTEEMNKYETEENDQDTLKSRKSQISTLFNNLEMFKDKEITLFLYGGDNISGILIGFDEVANCVVQLRQENSSCTPINAVVLGRTISMVCQGYI